MRLKHFYAFCSLLLSCKEIEKPVTASLPIFQTINIETNEDFKSAYESSLNFGGVDYTNATSSGGVSINLLVNECQNRRFSYVSRYIDMPNGLLIDLIGISGRIKSCCSSQMAGTGYDTSGFRLHRIYVHDSRMKRVLKNSNKHLVNSIVMDSYGYVKIDYGFERFIHIGMPINSAESRLYQIGYIEDSLKNYDFIQILKKIKEQRDLPYFPSKVNLVYNIHDWNVYQRNEDQFIFLYACTNYFGDRLLNSIIAIDDDQYDEYEFLKL